MTEQESKDAGDRKERHVQWERRFQSVVISLGTGAIFWAAGTLMKVDKGLDALKPHVDNLDIQIAGMYRSADAKRDVAELATKIAETSSQNAKQDGDIQDIKTRVTTLEYRVNKVTKRKTDDDPQP
jgi:chromosome segregation ATPase